MMQRKAIDLKMHISDTSIGYWATYNKSRRDFDSFKHAPELNKLTVPAEWIKPQLLSIIIYRLFNETFWIRLNAQTNRFLDD